MKPSTSEPNVDRALYRGSQNLAQALTEDQIYEVLFDELRHETPCEISVYLFRLVKDEPIWAELRANWHKNDTPSYPLHTRFYLPETPQTRLITTATPLFVDDIATDTRLTPEEQTSFEPTGACSAAVLPLKTAGRDLGALVVYFTQPYTFTPAVQQLWLTLTNQAGTGLIYQQATQNLTYQAVQIDTAAEVARTAGSILDLQDLLNSAVNLIQDRFELYYAGIFLVDEQKEWAVLQAGTGQAGQAQIKAGHRLRVGGESMIGWSIANRQARIALDVGKDAVHFQNPYLPHTRSEMALPLVSLQEVIGAVTIQSTEQAAFSQQDIVILRIIADQLAVAIENAHLFTRSKESESKYRELVENANSVIFRMDTNGVITFFNEFAQEFFGYTAQEIIGQNLLGTIVPHTDTGGADLKSLVNDLITEPEAYATNINENIRKNGERVWVSWTNKAVTDSEGNLTEVLCIGNDITDLRYTQEALFQSQDRLSTILKSVQAGIITIDAETRQIVDANPAALEMIGADRRQVIGNICHEFVCPAQQGQCPVCDLGYEVDNSERILLTAQNQIVPIIKNVAQADLGGKRYLIESFVNISEQKQAENALQENLTRTESLFAISNTLNSLQDEQSILEEILGEYLKMLDLKRGSIVLFNPESGYNYVQALYLNGQPAKSGLTFDATQDTVAQHLTQTPQPLVIENVRTHPLTRDDEKLVDTVNSMLLIPLLVQETITGIMSADATETEFRFSQNDIALGEAVADQLSIWLQNRRLFTEAQHRSNLLQTAAEVSRAASSILDTNELIQTSVDLIRDHFNFYYVGLFLVDPKGEWAVLQAGTGQAGREQIEAGHRLKVGGEGMIGWSIANRQPRIALDVGKDAVHFQNPYLPDTRSEMALPLISRDEALGALTVQSEKERAFSQEDVTQLQTMTDQLANALANARLYQASESSLAETQRLYEISRALVESSGLGETFDVILENVKTYNIDRVSISLLDKDAAGQIEKVVIAASWDRDSNRIVPVGSIVSSDNFSLVKTFAQPPFTPLVSEDLTRPDQQDERMDDGFRQMMVNDLNAVTMFSAPMYLGREYKGVLSISTRGPHTYTQQEQRIYQTLADQAIIAIERHRLLAETRQSLFNSEILSNLSQRLLTAETPDAIYDLTLKAIAATNPERGAAIFLFDLSDEATHVELTAIWDNPSREWPKIPVGTRYALVDLQMRPLLSQGETVISDNISQAEDLSDPMRHVLEQIQVESLVAVPIWQDRRVGGFIMITHPRAHPFPADIIRLYEDIGRLTSGALENRRLFDEAAYRAAQLQTAAEVSQAATGQLDLNTLLTQSVNLVRDRFGFYHASIFLVDDYRRYAVVQASTGKIGRKMLQMQHKLAVGGKSIVGTAVDTGKPRIALDVGQDAVHFDNPLLPDTRSEMALPLIARGQVIGALDVQSTKANAFSESDIAILQSMAGQLANAIEAARAYQKTQTALTEVSELQERYSRTEWTDFIKTQQKTAGYRLTPDGFLPIHHHDELPPPAQQVIRQALTEKQQVTRPGNDTDQTTEPNLTGAKPISLATPLALQEQVPLGTLDFETHDEHLQDEDIPKIIEAVARQAAQAMQTARLFEQTQVAQSEAESLFRLSRALVTAQNRAQMFETTLKEFLGVLDLPQGGVLLFEPGRRFGKLHALYRDGKPTDTNLRIPIEDNPSYQKLIETRQPVVIEDFATDPLVATVRDIDLGHQIASLLLAPIVIDDEVVGSIGADAVKNIRRFSSRDVNLAMTMADQLSIALQNRRLLEETRTRARELQETARQLQEMDRLKTQFLANMSHELRTPLNSIIGFSRVILKGIDGPLTELQKSDLTSIYNSGQHLLSLINNILDISKIEAGKMELNFEEMEIGPIIKSVMSTATALVKDKPITLQQEMPDTLPAVWADPTRIRQIVLNLVSNACKFTEKGEITLETNVTDEDLVIRVTDTGIGIEPEKLESIFEEFTQVDASTTRKAGGTGLGLPISRYFVEMHGGQIWVDSSPGQGSTFSITIPLNGNRSPLDSDDSHDSQLQKQISVVALEPDSGVTNLYRRYLDKRNYNLVSFNDWQNQDIFAEIKQHNPDAILLETVVPNQDGWQILKTLKQDTYTRDIPIITCSISSDHNRSLSLGAADHLTKPIVEGELINSLQQIFSRQKAQTRVLVIDDHADDVLLIRRMLEAHDLYVSEASCGQEGLDLALQRNPDLIILDLTMPGMDGFTVIESLKSIPQTSNIPIIIVSAREISAEENEFLTGRIEVLLNKGALTEKDLLAVVNQALD